MSQEEKAKKVAEMEAQFAEYEQQKSESLKASQKQVDDEIQANLAKIAQDEKVAKMRAAKEKREEEARIKQLEEQG